MNGLMDVHNTTIIESSNGRMDIHDTGELTNIHTNS